MPTAHLKQQIQEYVMEEAMKEMEKDQSERLMPVLNDDDPDTGFGDRFEAVMLDLLNGTHVPRQSLMIQVFIVSLQT